MDLTLTQKRRLTKLANHLEKVPQDHFNMAYVFVDHLTGQEFHTGKSEVDKFPDGVTALKDCGTAACVLGHAMGVFKVQDVYSFLDLGYTNERRLFTPNGYTSHPTFNKGEVTGNDENNHNGHVRKASELFTPANAAKAVRELRRTGQVPRWWWDNEAFDGDENAEVVVP